MQKNYVSPVDKLLKTFDKKNPKKSASQKQEIKKFEWIFKHRDEVKPKPKAEAELWKDF